MPPPPPRAAAEAPAAAAAGASAHTHAAAAHARVAATPAAPVRKHEPDEIVNYEISPYRDGESERRVQPQDSAPALPRFQPLLSLHCGGAGSDFLRGASPTSQAARKKRRRSRRSPFPRGPGGATVSRPRRRDVRALCAMSFAICRHDPSLAPLSPSSQRAPRAGPLLPDPPGPGPHFPGQRKQVVQVRSGGQLVSSVPVGRHA